MMRQLGWAVGNVHYRMSGKLTLLDVCFGKVRSDARSDQLIALARCLYETLPLEYRDLPAAALDQTCAFQPMDSIRDGRPLNTQHFGEQALGDRQ